VPGAVLDARQQARAIIANARATASNIAAVAAADGRARAFQAARAELSEQTRELALLAAQHLVQAELELKPERITAVVESLLVRVRRAERVLVRSHPDDLAALSAWRDENELVHVELEGDATLARGGCIVITPIGTLDASLETRVQALRDALAKAAKAP